jgi:hypothetical protein
LLVRVTVRVRVAVLVGVGVDVAVVVRDDVAVDCGHEACRRCRWQARLPSRVGWVVAVAVVAGGGCGRRAGAWGLRGGARVAAAVAEGVPGPGVSIAVLEGRWLRGRRAGPGVFVAVLEGRCGRGRRAGL